jgi:hypothetical protein
MPTSRFLSPNGTGGSVNRLGPRQRRFTCLWQSKRRAMWRLGGPTGSVDAFLKRL